MKTLIVVFMLLFNYLDTPKKLYILYFSHVNEYQNWPQIVHIMCKDLHFVTALDITSVYVHIHAQYSVIFLEPTLLDNRFKLLITLLGNLQNKRIINKICN